MVFHFHHHYQLVQTFSIGRQLNNSKIISTIIFSSRTTKLAYFLIDGATVIDLQISELIVLTFGLPPTTPSAFYSVNVAANLAALLGVTPDQIRRVNVISASGDM